MMKSAKPCSSWNSAFWKPSGSFCPVVCSMTRCPAKPMRAPGSAAITSEIYTIPSGADSLTLTCTVLHCDEIGGAWTAIKTSEVAIKRTTNEYTFDLGGDVDLSSGFFKVKLEK